MLDKTEIRKIVKSFTDSVCQKYKPKQVILFGSHVNGEPHKYSDIDIAVIFEFVEGDFLGTWSELFGLCEGISFDIEPHLLDETCNRSGFLDYIRKTGEIIYEG